MTAEDPDDSWGEEWTDEDEANYEAAGMYGEYEDDSHLAMYDDDPSPYDGTYSEM